MTTSKTIDPVSLMCAEEGIPARTKMLVTWNCGLVWGRISGASGNALLIRVFDTEEITSRLPEMGMSYWQENGQCVWSNEIKNASYQELLGGFPKIPSVPYPVELDWKTLHDQHRQNSTKRTPSVLSNILKDVGGKTYTLTSDSPGIWKASLNGLHHGTGDSAESALIEAYVDQQIDKFYLTHPKQPPLSMDEMNMRLKDAYRKYLNIWPKHTYRGKYRE